MGSSEKHQGGKSLSLVLQVCSLDTPFFLTLPLPEAPPQDASAAEPLPSAPTKVDLKDFPSSSSQISLQGVYVNPEELSSLSSFHSYD